MTIPQNIKAVIFDADGLMINSEPAWLKTHDDFLKKYNIVMDEEALGKLHGIGLKQLIVRLRDDFHLEKSVEDLLSEYREVFYKNFSASEEMKIMEGVEEVAQTFFERGFQLAVATGGHTKKSMEEMLMTFNLLKYFEVIVSGDEVEKGKPNPDIFLLTAEKLGRLPSECLVLEDSVNGVVAAKAAGMRVVGVNKVSKYYHDMKEAGADEVFKSLRELISL